MVLRLLSQIIDVILPPKDDVRIAEALDAVTLTRLMRPHLAKEHWVVSLFPYSDPRIRALIRAVKFYGAVTPLPIVAEIIGGYLLEMIADKRSFSGWNAPLLVPIPSSALRLRTRGYNQTERFAEALLPALGAAVLYEPKALVRKDAKSQTMIPRASRAENMKNIFSAPDPGVVKGKQIILFDDVVESGATLKDARRALLSAGAADVFALAIAN